MGVACTFADLAIEFDLEENDGVVTTRDARKACNHKVLAKCEGDGADCFLANKAGRAQCEIFGQYAVSVCYRCYCSACEVGSAGDYEHGIVNPFEVHDH